MTISTCDRSAFIEIGVPTAVISLVVFVYTYIHIHIHIHVYNNICNMARAVICSNNKRIEAAGPDPIKAPHQI